MRKLTLVLALVAVTGFATSAFAGGSDHGCSSCHQPHMAGDPTDADAYGVPLWGNEYTGDGILSYDLYEGSALPFPEWVETQYPARYDEATQDEEDAA